MIVVNNERFAPWIRPWKTIYYDRWLSSYQDFAPRDIEARSGLCDLSICDLRGGTAQCGFCSDLYPGVARPITGRTSWIDDNEIGWYRCILLGVEEAITVTGVNKKL